MAIFNRTLWALIGLLCLAAGVAGLLGANGYFGGSVAHYEVASTVVRSAKQPAALLAVAIVLVGVIVAILGILLIRAQLNLGPPASFGDLHLPSEQGARGRTLLRSVALRRGLERDLAGIPGMRGVGVSLLGRPDSPWLQVRVEVESDRDLRTVEQAIARAVERFNVTLGAPAKGGELFLRLSHPPPETLA